MAHRILLRTRIPKRFATHLNRRYIRDPSPEQTTEKEGLDTPFFNLAGNPEDAALEQSTQPLRMDSILPISVEDILASQSADPRCRQIFQDLEARKPVEFQFNPESTMLVRNRTTQ